ncbi:MAG TPA: YhjD/YihY/BrkB family envelope integrity protein [Pleomorphomonadaceae bacterium]|nr:YhjD/YihY/BrkB family envelope integrity protein [Pleomorphomonadaceae bacterium]
MTAIADRLKQRLAALSDRSWLISIGVETIRNFNAHEASTRAAAIAFYSVLSLFPFAMVGLVVASFVIGEGPELEVFVANVADRFGLDPATVSGSLEALLDARSGLALVGLGLLVVALVPWVSAVQLGIVRAFREDRRSVAHSTLSSLLLLVMAAVLILLSGVWASLIDLVIGFLERFMGDVVNADATLRVGLLVLPALVVFAVMTVLLSAVPAHRPWLRDVSLGAMVTALGFLGLRLVFDFYVQQFVAKSGNAAGPFGAILVGLLYVDFLAIAMLAGAEVAGVVFRRRQERDGSQDSDPE